MNFPAKILRKTKQAPWKKALDVKADYFFPKIAGLKFPRRTSLILLFFLLEPFFPQSIAFPL